MATERTPLSRNTDDDEVDYEDLIEKRPGKSRRKWYALLLMAMIGVGIFLGIYLTRDSSDNPSSNVWDQIRLPSYIRPTHYNLVIDTDLIQSTFSGSIDATITTTNETNVIICHVLELEIDHVNVTNGNGTSISINRHFFVPQHQFLVIELSSTLTIGSYNVHIAFHAPLKNQLVGYYRSTYVTEDGKNHTLATTKFEPTHARRAFPCWDEPAMKATYDITLISHTGLTYISNMPIAKNTTLPNNRSMVIFQRSVRMSSYLVVFIVSDFTSLPSVQSYSKLFPNDNKTISVYTNAARLNQTKLALQVASLVLAHFEDYFGIPYPLPKLDLIAIPDFQSGAMENWGAITFRETSLLYDETQSSASDMQAIITTISHELSHQWFGNLVTMSWWDGLWLNEGFASYMEYLGASAVYPKLGLLDQFISTDLNNALTLDASINSHPIVQQVTDPNQINQLFDSISYDKGASVIRMMVGFLSEETFVKGLKSYLQTHAYGNAESSDLWTAMTAATNGAVPVGEIMDTWTKQMGFPLLTLERTSNITATVTGATHRFVVGDDPNPGTFSWYIPISSVTSRGESPSTFYKPTQDSIALPVSSSDSWIKLNRNGTAVYRTKYDNVTLAALANALLTRDPVLSVTDRTQLLSDVWALAAQGSGDYPTALSFSQFLPSEQSYPVWVIALSQLRTLSSFLSNSTNAQSHWERYLNHTLTPITDYVGWNKSEDHQTCLLQGIILRMAITNNISDSRHQALLRWNASITSNTTIDPNIRDAVYLEAIRSDSHAWNYMWECYRTNSVVSVALKCLQSMATSKNVEQLSWLLNATVDGSIRSQDALTVIRLVASNSVGQRLAWTFVQQNWDTLYATFVQGGGRTFGPMIGSIISEYSTQQDYKDISDYLKDRDVGPGASSVQDGLASILRRIQWLQKNEDIVVNWLKAH